MTVLDSAYVCPAPGCHTPRFHAERDVPCPNCDLTLAEAEVFLITRIEELILEREKLKLLTARGTALLKKRRGELERFRPPPILQKLTRLMAQRIHRKMEIMSQLIVGCQLRPGDYNRHKARLIAEGRLPRTL